MTTNEILFGVVFFLLIALVVIVSWAISLEKRLTQLQNDLDDIDDDVDDIDQVVIQHAFHFDEIIEWGHLVNENMMQLAIQAMERRGR